MCYLGVGERGDWREHVLSHRQTLCYENNDRLAAPKETKATHYTFTQTAKYVYIYILYVCVRVCVCACKYLYLYTVYTYVIYFIYFL